MEISKDIQIVDLALYLNKFKTLIINDLHLGYEEVLYKKGFLIPKYQIKEIIKQLEKILDKVSPETIIINGDLKHEFGRVLSQEWRDVLNLIDYLSTKCKKIIIIQGNHDKIIEPIARKRNVYVLQEYSMGNILIIHGDRLVKTESKRIIIGHEHPAITIREGSKYEKYKCFLKGKWDKKELIAVPSFNPLLEGTDVTKEKILSPFLKDLQKFEVYVVNKGEIFKFGKIKDLTD